MTGKLLELSRAALFDGESYLVTVGMDGDGLARSVRVKPSGAGSAFAIQSMALAAFQLTRVLVHTRAADVNARNSRLAFLVALVAGMEQQAGPIARTVQPLEPQP